MRCNWKVYVDNFLEGYHVPYVQQHGLRSRAYDRGRFSVRFEEGVHHFQQLLKQAYRSHLSAR